MVNRKARGVKSLHAACGVALLLAGCLSEPPRVEAPKEKLPEPENRITLTIAHVTGARVVGGDAASARRLEEAVSIASQVQGLDVIVFGGDSIANEDASKAPVELETFAGLAGIVAAKRVVVLGDRERKGALPRLDVVRALERKKLILDRSGTWSDAPKAGARIVAIDVDERGSVTRETALAAMKAIREAKEPVIVIVADRPPLDPELADLMRRDARVKLSLFRGAEGRAEDPAGEPASIATPSLDATSPVIRVIEIDGVDLTTRLLSVPAGEASREARLVLRRSPPTKAPAAAPAK